MQCIAPLLSKPLRLVGNGNVECREVSVGRRCLDGCGDHQGGPCTR